MSEDANWKELVNPPPLGEVDVRLGIEFGKPNANGRAYPKEVWERAMQEARQRVEARTMLVYYGEPTLNNTVAIVQEITENGGEACAGVKFLDNPKGQAMHQLIEHGGVNFFTCGVGSVIDGVVQNDYQLEYVSIRANPQNPNVRLVQEPA